MQFIPPCESRAFSVSRNSFSFQINLGRKRSRPEVWLTRIKQVIARIASFVSIDTDVSLASLDGAARCGLAAAALLILLAGFTWARLIALNFRHNLIRLSLQCYPAGKQSLPY